MNQNVVGVILFSVIVGIAIFVSEYFAPIPAPLPVYERPVTVDNKYSCSHRSRTVINQSIPVGVADIKVVQAVLNPQANVFNAEFLIKKENPRTEAVGIALHFFVKNGRTTQYLATETITVVPDFDSRGNATDDVTASFKWLNNFEQRNNLYVIAEPSSNYNKSKDLEPIFDESKATSVLLDKGK